MTPTTTTMSRRHCYLSPAADPSRSDRIGLDPIQSDPIQAQPGRAAPRRAEPSPAGGFPLELVRLVKLVGPDRGGQFATQLERGPA